MARTALLSILMLSFILLPGSAFASSSSAYKPSSVGVSLEVTMSGDGGARVAGARVREVTDTGFTAETLWGSGKLTWTVRTSEDTPVLRKNGARIVLQDITAGDYVSFTGMIQTNMPPFTVDADTVRDWSIGENHSVLSGTVSAIDKDAHAFTLTTGKGGTIIVKTNESTAYAQSGAQSFADLTVGDQVLAFGEGSKTMTATKVNITEHAATAASARPVIATGLGPWIDQSLSLFFVGRMN